MSKVREDVIFCRFKAENIVLIYEEKGPITTRLLSLQGDYFELDSCYRYHEVRILLSWA
jgi:hypothetical protein